LPSSGKVNTIPTASGGSPKPPPRSDGAIKKLADTIARLVEAEDKR